MTLPQWSTTVAVGPLVVWMLLLTVKHVIGDFLLQTTWMAKGKDSAGAWLVPLTAHCLIHGALATLLFAVLAPKLWFLGIADFVVHLIIDRTKGYLVAKFQIAPGHQWFWWLIGIDQALHHVTDFAWSLLVVTNGYG
ncbi:DUF3307 domain-containing protein [Bradyrhizobium sp. U87765 SZCCT0131]|uniref:DUF3307 domain-containing protein n=1 Tax=unclassified Bradyrhizobium TaxID=2631580 RepID=UPI001BA750F0|nr:MULTISPECIES: DUF3307 domain-containing protein [unclassified Bradyrhizobium]MBR1220672.1 DUF3307 domain-containing protein [Bradyrhizobium sp. U87765 SZCCT0131]MBR1262874.1 DUF3307 domain-containing protein [Bradyrhizobium sp. U87765 SZCCT0134]MBR1307244.1 DUF3307 domain-containing protein [Bradyrhizobium sp. U87765 SZCCT0110]MBR1322869.1 DUF3307 domain-containing protein [Bradyrhizobium sp. U87765 SZCCT0109]MBR1346198.1 DUF3307 domain-containing protein [Bradyrhizobium sp. U87765 SZCCT004